MAECSFLVVLNLSQNLMDNSIGNEGAGRLAGMLGQCSSLAELNLVYNDIGNEGARSLAGGAVAVCVTQGSLCWRNSH